MEIPYTSPNQRVVVTHKTQSDKEHLYGVVNIEAVLAAMQNLSDRAFKLYARMNLHQNEFTYALSPAALNKETGLSVGRYREAVRELIDKGYLQQSDKKNVYHFWESLKSDDSVLKSNTVIESESDDDVLNSYISNADNNTMMLSNSIDDVLKSSTSPAEINRINNIDILQEDNTDILQGNNSCYYNTKVYNKDSTAKKEKSINLDLADYESVLADDSTPF